VIDAENWSRAPASSSSAPLKIKGREVAQVGGVSRAIEDDAAKP